MATGGGRAEEKILLCADPLIAHYKDFPLEHVVLITIKEKK